MIELILNTKFLFFSFTQVLHVSPLVAITKEKESEIFRLYFSCVCSGGVVGHWDTHGPVCHPWCWSPTAQLDSLSPSTLLCAQCKTSVWSNSWLEIGSIKWLTWRYGVKEWRLQSCRLVNPMAALAANTLVDWKWPENSFDSIDGQKIFLVTNTHTHTTPLYRLFSLTNIHTRWLAGWLAGAHTQLTLYTLAVPTHTGRLMPRLFYRTSPPLSSSLLLPMRARHQFPSGGGKRVFGWRPRWLSRPPLDVTTRQRLCRANKTKQLLKP